MLHLIEQACAVASSVLLGAKRRRTQGACSSLPPTLQPTTCKIVCDCRCDGALPLRRSRNRTLHLIEQACSCASVQGGGRRKVRDRPCRRHSNPTTCKIVRLPLRPSCHSTLLHLIEQACAAASRSEAERGRKVRACLCRRHSNQPRTCRMVFVPLR